MQTKELADWLGLGTSTVRKWAGREFRDYLSPSAQGGDNRARNFTDQDARIIALIVSLRSEGVSHGDIHATLRRLQTEGWQELPPMPPAPPGVGPVDMIPREAAETAVNVQRSAMMREVAILQDRVKTLEEVLASERQKHEEERLVLQTELVETKERLGELRGKLAERRPSEWWLRLMVVAVVAALVLGVGLTLLVILASGGGG